MWTAAKQVEITVRVANGPASLGRLIAVASSCGTELLAACSYWDQAGAVVMLVAEDALRAKRTLEGEGFKCKANEVVLVEMPDIPGLAPLLGAKLTSAGIHVLYSYAFRSGGDRSYVVFKTSNDDRAVYFLEFEALVESLTAAKRWPRQEQRGRLSAALKLEKEQEVEPRAA